MTDNMLNKLFNWWKGLTKKQRGIIFIVLDSIVIVALLIVLVNIILWDPSSSKKEEKEPEVNTEQAISENVSNNVSKNETEVKDEETKVEEPAKLIESTKTVIETKITNIECNHKWVINGLPVEATCEQMGITPVKCAECGSEGRIEEEKLNHAYNDSTYKILKEATCNSKGQAEYICTRCGKRVTQVIEAGEHRYSTEFTIDLQPTCGKDGEKSRRCTICGEKTDVTKIPALSHELITDIVNPTCTKDGATTVKCKNCSFVQTVTIKALGHRYGDKVIDKEPTCKEAGEKSKHCLVCQDKAEKEEIAALGHDWGNAERIEPTCTVDGSEQKTCKRCGEKETVILKATGHDWEQIDTKYRCKKCSLEVETLP